MRALLLGTALGITMAASLESQVPRAVSPRLAPALARRDTTVVVWIIARHGTDLERIAELVRNAGGRVRHLSRFVPAVSAHLTGHAIAALAREREVRRIQPVAVFVRGREPPFPAPPEPPRPEPSAPAGLDTSVYGPGAWAFRQLNIPALHARGLTGAGVRIAVLDAGFNTRHPFMAGANVVAQRDFVYGDSVVRDQPGEVAGEMAHGTATWSLIAARAPGRLFGVAPDAEFLLAKTEFGPTETRTEEDNWVAGVEWAALLGAHIISSSLGYLRFDDGSGYSATELTGDIAVTTVAADSAARRGILVVVAAGNSGPAARSLSTPADGDSVVAVGATDSLRRVAGFSSRGPTADGRLKPEVVAPGDLVTVAAQDSGLTITSGTSFSTPLVAGLAALVQSGRPGRPAVELRRGLVHAASHRFDPDNTRGYGIPDALNALAFPTGVTPVSPTDSVLATVTPTFVWSAESPRVGIGPLSFRLQVGTDSALATLVFDTTVADTSVTLRFAPRPGTRLFWRVTARSPLGVAESTSVRGPLVIPPWAVPLTFSVRQGVATRDSQPLLVWRSPAVAMPPGPFTYDVDILPAVRRPPFPVAGGRGLRDTTFRPPMSLERNATFFWRVVARLVSGDSAVMNSQGTFIVVDESVPAASLLFQNFPNPFPNRGIGLTATCIWFDVAERGQVRLEIFDLRGRRIRRLVPSAEVPPVLAAGRYGRGADHTAGSCDPRFRWDGRDETGAYVRPGVYFYRLTAPGLRDLKRIVFLGPP